MSLVESKQNDLTVNRHIGEKIKQRRKALNLSQIELAKHLEISAQQLHKYEKGVDRVSASKLVGLSKVLSVSPKFFYQGLEGFSTLHSRGVIVVCKNKEGKKISLKLLDDDHIFSEIKVLKKNL